jgi:hypothetical protein
MRANGRLIGIVLLATVAAAAGTLFGVLAVPVEHHAEHPGHHEAEAAHADQLRPSELASAILVSFAGIGIVPLALRGLRRRNEMHSAPLQTERGVAEGLRFVVALASAGAATIHFAVIAQHFEEYWLFGTFFVGVGLLQLAWAVLVVARPSPGLYLAGAAGNAVVAAMWIVSRTAGLPLGPEAGEPEAVGLADTVATVYEIVLASGALVLLRVTAPRRQLARVTAATALTTLAVIGLTMLSLLSLAGL